ncbi:MAG: hypothetical protein SGBAC_000593 [Bacillariaceae sp.]
MVKVFLKGGTWKNSEDEILKAAVQKYGKQQWARVASLLNRKSAKQCKARWHEWLDPSVRKVEWSREEEEKLLHLAKLMPAQWKTIGPLVGRTATQCQEHYEKLLDEAAAGKGDDDNEQSLRSQPLRVGQIDSHPETKPARPDPIDMDEDEIEMLQEARARLANTQGKKAKRKAREKMLAQAKRLTELQKRRELKQAGLISGSARKKAKRSRDIDLGVEIPFHKPAPAGFHDVTSEAARSESIRAKSMKSVDFKKLNEQQYRSRDREAAQSKKREEARLRTLEKSNMQYVVAQVSKTNDPLNIRKRGRLELPSPSVTDHDLKQMAKMDQDMPDVTSLQTGTDATKALLADYTDRPLPTPMRTPMASSGSNSKHDSILREASNLRALERGQTPLLGGEERLEDSEQEGDEHVPKTEQAATSGMLSEHSKTPRRDHYGLNQRPQSELRGPVDDTGSVGASTFATNMSIRELAREERRAAKLARKGLEEALAALPAPQFDYELEAPANADEDVEMGTEQSIVEDAADIDAAEQKRLQEEAAKLYEARSSVVKRAELPRVVGAIVDTKFVSTNDAEKIIDAERWNLLRHDAHTFPVDSAPAIGEKKKKRKKNVKQAPIPPETPLDPIPEAMLNDAKDTIEAELKQLLEQRAQPYLQEGKPMENARIVLSEEILKASRGSKLTQEVFVAGTGWTATTKETRLQSLLGEYDTLQAAASALRKRNEKTESKITVLVGGYSKRAEVLSAEMSKSYGELRNLIIEESVYKGLQHNEEVGAVKRIDCLRADIQRLQKDEPRLQNIYEGLTTKNKVGLNAE